MKNSPIRQIRGYIKRRIIDEETRLASAGQRLTMTGDAAVYNTIEARLGAYRDVLTHLESNYPEIGRRTRN